MRGLLAYSMPLKKCERHNLYDKYGIIHITFAAWTFWRSVASGGISSL